MNKKLIIGIAGTLVILGIATYFFIYKNNDEMDEILTDANEENFAKSIEKLKNEGYSNEVLADVERIFRLETAHFKSGQFKRTYSPGMEVHGPARSGTSVFGWNVRNFAGNSKYPTTFIEMPENQTGIKKKFIKFDNLTDSVRTLANYINYYGNPARWYSTAPDLQASYLAKLSKINPKYA